MFYLRYLRSELLRRRARTVLTVLGLAVGVGLVIAISGLSRGLDNAQKTALNPLSTIGTDLTVTRAAQSGNAGFGGGPGGGGGELIQANSSVITDLSKLGKPGTHFVHDFFPGAFGANEFALSRVPPGVQDRAFVIHTTRGARVHPTLLLGRRQFPADYRLCFEGVWPVNRDVVRLYAPPAS